MKLDLSIGVKEIMLVVSFLVTLVLGGVGGWYVARIDHETRIIKLEVWIGNVPAQPAGPQPPPEEEP